MLWNVAMRSHALSSSALVQVRVFVNRRMRFAITTFGCRVEVNSGNHPDGKIRNAQESGAGWQFTFSCEFTSAMSMPNGEKEGTTECERQVEKLLHATEEKREGRD
ncbi:uncharacterized protein VTP21DRAFT_8240 [Calcarisporiella thermophila]|uniref:uncharacterized protein n=1 Tax=Calcarisporiella thermophila TaxID=911321 RepID=UPI003743AB3A